MFNAYPQEAKTARAKYPGNIRITVNSFNPPLIAPAVEPGTPMRPKLAPDGSIETHLLQVAVAGQVELLDEEGALYDRINVSPRAGLPPKVAQAVAALLD